MILNIFKPRGRTSFYVVKNIRRIIKDKKVGHGGTLDPFAEGVLIIGTGKDTKRLSNFINDEKVYVAGLELGIKTDTLDPEGKIIVEKSVPVLTKDEIKTVLGLFLGESLQIPPMFSAKRINGQRLYKLARQNIKIKREPVKINISDITLIDYKENIITFSVRCSKGTYVRVLGKDIAEKLNTVGSLQSLIRTNVGRFSIKDSIKINSKK